MTSTTSGSSNAITAEPMLSPMAGTVTLTHDDFTDLLKMIQRDRSPPSAASANTGLSSSSIWLIDSGATDYMTNNEKLSVNFSSFRTLVMVNLVDSSKVPSLGKGDVIINSKLKIDDVLWVLLRA